MESIVTCIAPVNIAVIKYWGKRDEKLILPTNDSISGTLSTNQMHAKTTAMISPRFTSDRIWLNGTEEDISNPRLVACLSEIRRFVKEQNKNEKNELKNIHNLKIHICSVNNFPTAAGLASSAAGYACLVYTLKELFGLKKNISSIARIGSGSACRSVFGGFVHWHKGELPDGSDSIATQIVPASYWPLHVLILVVNDKQKKVSSTVGMQKCVETSELVKHRIEKCVPDRTKEITQAILERDFGKFAEITMKDSNQFHAICLDTYPPVFYMNNVSYSIIYFVHKYNELFKTPKVAYTFDAGPNACIYLEKESVPDFVATLKHIFPPSDLQKPYIQGESVELGSINKKFEAYPIEEAGLFKSIIHTRVGEGPARLVSEDEHLLLPSGLPA